MRREHRPSRLLQRAPRTLTRSLIPTVDTTDGAPRQSGTTEAKPPPGVTHVSEHDLFPHSSLPITAHALTRLNPSNRIVVEGMKVVFVTSGWARLHSQFGAIDVEAGSIVAFPANVWCSADPIGGVETVTVYTQTDYVSTQLRWMPPSHPLAAHLRTAATEAETLSALKIGKTQMRALAPKLLSLASIGQRHGQEFTVLTLVSSLFQDIDHLAGSRGTAAPVPDTARAIIPRREVAQAVRALRSDLPRAWTLHELAGHVSLSESQLSRLFRSDLGISPGALLWQMRTDRVAELLATARVSAAEAFRQAGWASQSAASRAFKRRYGIGPREYGSRMRELGVSPHSNGEATPPTSLSALLVDS